MKKIKKFFQDLLGITNLQQQTYYLEKVNGNLVEEVRLLHEMYGDILSENKDIRQHLRFLNKEFAVNVDYSPSKYDPTVVLITKRGKQEQVRTYTFHDGAMEQIHRFVEGFGKENVRIDSGIRMKGPNFRY